MLFFFVFLGGGVFDTENKYGGKAQILVLKNPYSSAFAFIGYENEEEPNRQSAFVSTVYRSQSQFLEEMQRCGQTPRRFSVFDLFV